MKASRLITLPLGFVGGAALMYFADPQKGRRRRIGLHMGLHRGFTVVSNLAHAGISDIGHRGMGLGAVLGSHWRNFIEPGGEDDSVVNARIRSKLGRLVTAPHSIQVHTVDGRVCLEGLIPSDKMQHLLDRIARIPGVRGINNQLRPYRNSRQAPAPTQASWSPAVRLLVAATCSGAFVYGLYGITRPRNAMLVGLSAVFLARALSNIDARRLFGLNSDSRAVTVHKTINISAPIFRVYRFMTDLANFSHFMTDVVEVKESGRNRFHWVVRGLAGFPVSWNAVISRDIPNEVLAWRSEPGALVKHTGRIRFRANSDGSTQIDVELAYNPPGGALGHALAKLLGDDPKSKMNEDLMRLKTLIESGPSSRQISRGVTMH